MANPIEPVSGSKKPGSSTDTNPDVAMFLPNTMFMSDIAPANDLDIVAAAAMYAGSPQLMPIVSTVTVGRTLESYAQIVNNMLSSWGENVREEAKRATEKYLDDQIKTDAITKSELAAQAASSAGLPTTSSSDVARQSQGDGTIPSRAIDEINSMAANPLTQIGLGLQSFLNTEQTKSSTDNMALSLSSIAIGGMVSLAPIIQIQTTSPQLLMTDNSVNGKAVSDAYNQAMVFFPGMPDLGVLGSLMVIGLMYPVLNETQGASIGSKSEPLFDTVFAKKFAEKIAKVVTSDAFASLVMAILTQQTDQGQPLSGQQKEQLFHELTMYMIAQAMIVMYLAETGTNKITPEELTGMVMGDMTFPKGDIRASLQELIASHYNELTAENQAAFLASLPELCHSTIPKIVEELDPIVKAVQSVRETSYVFNADTPA